MEQPQTFVLSEIRKGKRKDYPDYFITIKQPGGIAATISRERNGSVSVHYHDNGVLTFDSQMVDSFENIKASDWNSLNLLKVAIADFSGELPSDLKNEIHDGVIYLNSFIRKLLKIEIGTPEISVSYQWFTDLINSEKGPQFLRHHLGTVRYFHGDFDPLQEFLRGDISDDARETDSFFEEPQSSGEGSFFEEDEDLDFEDDKSKK